MEKWSATQVVAVTLTAMSQAIKARPPRWPVVVMVLVAASAFGPFVAAGMRTDQLVVYGLAALLGVVGSMHIRVTAAQLVVVALLVSFIVFAAIQALFNPGLRGSASIAMLDNLVLPLAVCIVVLVLLSTVGRERLLRAVATVTVVGMCANALLTLTQVGGGSEALPLGPWRPGTVGTATVGDNAAALGRYTGILNQPSLAGILYGITILLAFYLLHRRPVWLTACTILLMMGGLLGISKAFLFVSLPVCSVVLITYLYRRSIPAVLGLLAIVVIFIPNRARVFDYLETETSWEGATRFRLVFEDLERVGGITGGRLGDDGSASAVTNYILDTSPFLGYGPGGLSEPTDTLWLLGMSVNGLLGLVVLVALLAVLAVAVFRRRATLSRVEYVVAVALVVILIGGAFGYPVFFGDRLAVPLWATIMLLLAAPSTPPPPGESPATSSEPRRSGMKSSMSYRLPEPGTRR